MNVETNKSNQLADDFKNHFADELSEDAVRRTVESLEKFTESQMRAATAYPANGSIASLVFYVFAQCSINGGKTFRGRAWGASLPGGGALFGDMYLVNATTLDQVYTETTHFKFVATTGYTSFYFNDSNGTLLATFQAGAISTVDGGGKGKGSWS